MTRIDTYFQLGSKLFFVEINSSFAVQFLAATSMLHKSNLSCTFSNLCCNLLFYFTVVLQICYNIQYRLAASESLFVVAFLHLLPG